MIVEILDYRPAKAKDPILTQPGKQRVVLRPTTETIWQDICLMNAKLGGKWNDADALEMEAKILVCIRSFVVFGRLNRLTIPEDGNLKPSVFGTRS